MFVTWSQLLKGWFQKKGQARKEPSIGLTMKRQTEDYARGFDRGSDLSEVWVHLLFGSAEAERLRVGLRPPQALATNKLLGLLSSSYVST